MLLTVCAAQTVAAAPPNYTMSPAGVAASRAFDKNDLRSAIPLFQAAAKAGDSGAQMTLGGLYQYGQGVPQDYREAHKWLSLASDQGWGEAMNNLAIMYKLGRGVPVDYATALKWLILAQERVVDPELAPMVADNIVSLKLLMTPKQIIAAQENANTWRRSHVGR